MASCQPANHKSLLWQESLSQALKASNLFQFQICFISRWSEQSYWFYFNPRTLKLSWMLIINAEAYSGTLALFLPIRFRQLSIISLISYAGFYICLNSHISFKVGCSLEMCVLYEAIYNFPLSVSTGNFIVFLRFCIQ